MKLICEIRWFPPGMDLFHDGVQSESSFDGKACIFEPVTFFSLPSFSLTMSDPTLETATGAMTTDASSSTVKFNVGGRLYEVPRSLVEKFPSTMLARMASGTWQKDPEATMFIGRSGERFEYILDYMRADKVWLPLTIPKAAILDDLAFYGFENVDPSKIDSGSSYMEAARSLLTCKEEHDQCMASNKTTGQCEAVAYECFLRLSQGKSLTMYFSAKKEPELYINTKVAVRNQGQFQDHLAKYGLAFVTSRYIENGGHKNGYYLTVKEKEDTIN
jgi:hypothetical protein